MSSSDLNVCAIDTETHLIEPGKLAPRLVCVSYCDGKQTGLLHRNDLKGQLKEFLDLRSYLIVGHNIAFDMAVLAQNDPSLIPHIFKAYNEGRIEDTQIREQLIDIARGRYRGVYRDADNKKHKREYSLSAIAKRRLKIEMEKDDWRLRYSELTETPIKDWPEGAKEYSRLDAQVTHEIFNHQESEKRFLKDSTNQSRAAFALHLLSCWGVVTDPDQVDRLAGTLEDIFERTKDEMKSAGLLRANGTKNLKAIRAKVQECLSNPPRTDKGSIKTDDQTLAKCDDPGLRALSEFKGAEKINSTWIKHLELGTTKPIQPYWNVLVETGRTSCRGPNLQNPHRAPGLRECFIPRKGFVYAACDYSSLEMCTLAQVCLWLFGGSALANAINQGIDPHLKLAAQIVGDDYETAGDRMRAGDKEIRNVRQLAKAANFGYPGGMGAEAFKDFAAGYGVKIDLSQSEKLRRDWFAAWPEMKKYFEHVSSVTRTPEARLKQFVSNRYRGGLRFTSACNSYFQGLAADGAKAALYSVVSKCYNDKTSALFGSRPVMFIHDEIIAELPQHKASAAGEELARVMRETMQTFTPDVKIGTSIALMDRWYKDAEETRNQNGDLILWEGKESERQKEN